jgi:hypothetical protein
MEESPRVLRFYREWIAEVPDELTTIVVHRKMPPLDVVPAELHGKPVVAVGCCYAGPVEEGERVVRPLRAFGSPVLDLCQPKPYVVNQAMFDPGLPHGWWYYMKSCNIAVLSDEVIDTVAEHSLRMSPLSTFPMFQLGGAVARVGEDETAFNGRTAAHTLNINATTSTKEGFDEEREWAHSLWSALKPHHTSVYVNFLMEEGEERIRREAYGPEKYERLKALKRRYDPDNFFRMNQNIPPG